MPQPARQHGGGGLRMARRDIDEGRRAGATVEVFIGAADREIRVAPCHVDRQSPRRMGQIPNGDDPSGLRLLRQRCHVMQSACAVIDLCQHQNGDLVRDICGHVLWRDDAQFQIAVKGADQPFGDIQVRWKVAAVRQDHLAVRHGECSGQRLKHLDRQGIPKGHMPGFCPDQSPNPVPQRHGLRHPASLVPAGDQHVAPFVHHGPAHPVRCCAGQGTKGVTVEVNHPDRQVKLILAGLKWHALSF